MDIEKEASLVLIKLNALQEQDEIYSQMMKDLFSDFKGALHQYIGDKFSESDQKMIASVVFGDHPNPEENREKKKSNPKTERKNKPQPTPEQTLAKKMFKEIAKKTHPDKFPGDDIKESFFKKAQKASKTGNTDELRAVAKNLGIILPPVTLEELTFLKKRIGMLEERIKGYSRTVPWTWNANGRNSKWIREFIKEVLKSAARS